MIRSYVIQLHLQSFLAWLETWHLEVGVWMKGNKLKMNDDKTELIAIGSKSKLKQVNTNSMVFQDCDCEIEFSMESWCVFGWVSLCVKFYISSFLESVRSVLS